MSVKQEGARFARAAIRALPQRLARTLLFRHRFGFFPSTRHPQTFQEKLNYRILNDRRELLVTASSKVASKVYVESLGIPSLTIPRTLWHGSSLRELAKIKSPRPWVLKPSHRSGSAFFGPAGYVPVGDYRTQLDKNLAEREYKVNKLWAYRNVKRELILEERIGDTSGLTDYKFFVFNGKVALTQVDTGRFSEHARTLYDEEFQFLDSNFGVSQGADSTSGTLLCNLADIASQVGREFDFVRVDLYHHEETTYFGELTVYPGGGLSPWPHELDMHVGSYWEPFPASQISDY